VTVRLPLSPMDRLSRDLGREVVAVVSLDVAARRLAGVRFADGAVVFLGSNATLKYAAAFDAALLRAGRPADWPPLGHRARRGFRTVLRDAVAAERARHHPPSKETPMPEPESSDESPVPTAVIHWMPADPFVSDDRVGRADFITEIPLPAGHDDTAA
jgi:hypothetical protein